MRLYEKIILHHEPCRTELATELTTNKQLSAHAKVCVAVRIPIALAYYLSLRAVSPLVSSGVAVLDLELAASEGHCIAWQLRCP
jgi:hypothetical protein